MIWKKACLKAIFQKNECDGRIYRNIDDRADKVRTLHCASTAAMKECVMEESSMSSFKAGVFEGLCLRLKRVKSSGYHCGGLLPFANSAEIVEHDTSLANSSWAMASIRIPLLGFVKGGYVVCFQR